MYQKTDKYIDEEGRETALWIHMHLHNTEQTLTNIARNILKAKTEKDLHDLKVYATRLLEAMEYKFVVVLSDGDTYSEIENASIQMIKPSDNMQTFAETVAKRENIVISNDLVEMVQR